jgi:hypothetical protein
MRRKKNKDDEILISGLRNIAAALGVSVPVLIKMMKMNEFPFFQIEGGTYYTTPRALVDWAEKMTSRK